MDIEEDKPMLAKFFLGALMVMAVGVLLILIFQTDLSESESEPIPTTMEPVESETYAIPAAGTNLRAYSFTDSHGRNCTGVYSTWSNAITVWGDCDYPPNWTPE